MVNVAIGRLLVCPRRIGRAQPARVAAESAERSAVVGEHVRYDGGARGAVLGNFGGGRSHPGSLSGVPG